MAWTYSDWVTKATGSQDRVDRLRLHVQEVTQELQAERRISDLSESTLAIQKYLDTLLTDNLPKEEALAEEIAVKNRVGFTRGRPIL